MNVKLLRQIKAHILADPDQFRMDTWTCGTAHCIAGWALLLNDIPIENPAASAIYQRTVSGEHPMDVATELLDVEDDAASRLFNEYGWPCLFWSFGMSRAEKARLAAARIDHFIATDGRE